MRSMNDIGFPCKTPGCQTWLKVGEVAKDTMREKHIPVNTGSDPDRLKCPRCGQHHDYYFSEMQIMEPPVREQY